jgi:hypothetical protein
MLRIGRACWIYLGVDLRWSLVLIWPITSLGMASKRCMTRTLRGMRFFSCDGANVYNQEKRLQFREWLFTVDRRAVAGMTDISRDRYGDEKPASEMLFSYGFLENDRTEAREISLHLDIPEDDPLSLAKKIFCQNDSGLRIVAAQDPDVGQEVTWESALAWIACVNEEDGLHFGVAQTIDGSRELETTWNGQKIESPSHLRELLAADPLWEIFQLRAVVLLLERLETQLAFLQETEEIISNLREDKAVMESIFRPGIFESISQYRNLEGELLEKAVEDLIKQVSDLIRPLFRIAPCFRTDPYIQRTELLASQTVATYFMSQTKEPDGGEDFS